MRVLILTAVILASGTAAPSNPLIGHLTIPAVVPAAIPTISPGDIQAAVIDAKVQIEDQARAIVDQAKEQAEQAIEQQNEKISEVNDVVKEKSEEAFWAVEEKKWQALDAIKTAEAQIDGSVASQASLLAKSAIGGVIVPSPIIAPIPGPVITPIVSPVVSPILYAAPGFVGPSLPGIVAPAVKSISTEFLTQTIADNTKAIEKETEAKSDAAVKSAAIATAAAAAEATVKTAEITEEKKEGKDEAAVAKTADAAAEVQKTDLGQNVIKSPAVLTPLALAGAENWIAPVAYVQPGLKTFSSSTVQQIQGQILTPYVKAW